MLRVVKSKQPLLQAGKTLYRLSKDSSNDALFRTHSLLEPLVHAVHVMVASSATSSTPSSLHEVRAACRPASCMQSRVVRSSMRLRL